MSTMVRLDMSLLLVYKLSNHVIGAKLVDPWVDHQFLVWREVWTAKLHTKTSL
jgi:hypothetical protein